MSADSEAVAVPTPIPSRVRFHLRFGWWALFSFACVGLLLEAMHGFKVAYYLDVANETRRLMWRLGHAHGVLLGLLNVAFGATLHTLGSDGAAIRLGARGLLVASLLMPIGFISGGFGIRGGDPGLGIALVPLGGIALLVGLGSIAIGLGAHLPGEDER